MNAVEQGIRRKNMLRTILSFVAGMVLACGVVAFVAWVLWWLWTRRSVTKVAAPIEIEPKLPEPIVAALPVEPPGRAAGIALEVRAPAGPVVPDDLTRIEGIGPKISGVLHGAGIATFAQLAAASPDHLAQILQAADPRLLRLADPTSWPQQSALAATGEWQALEALQGALKGGRRA